MFGNKTVLKVEGMSCAHCEGRVEAAVAAVDGVKSVKASAKKGEVSFSPAGDEQTIARVKGAITEVGYQVME